MAKLLPNGKQTFLDADGNPLSGGFVYMYQPSTTTPKDTWQDSAEATLNANPIELDMAGRAVIYGNGVYRQIVKDADLVTIWDKEVAIHSPQAVLWGGIATGTANNLSVALENGDLEVESGSPVGGQLLCFIAGETNTGPAQLTVTWPGPETNGPIEIVKNSAIGPAPLEGGEIVEGNALMVLYDDNAGEWFLLNGVAVGSTFVPAAFSVDQPLAGQTCVLVLVRAYTLAEDAPGSYAYAEDLATNTVAIDIRKNGTVIGTITFTSASAVGTIVFDAAVDFVATDRLVLEFPPTIDPTLGAIGVTLKLQRASN
jgi:hypothetical protein